MSPLPARIGKYEFEQYLGGGGMAHVYRARDTVLGRPVAIKILAASTVSDPEARARFLREAQACGNLNHENVIQIYDFGKDAEGSPYMVMEFLRGEDLSVAIRNSRTGDIASKLRIARDIAAALEYTHANGVVHRDVKPENIYITETGTVKLMDFGIARAGASNITQAGMAIGTPAYMAPEQIRGEATNELVDVYAFGVVLYELFTASRAFRKDTFEQVFYAAINEPLNEQLLRSTGVPPVLTTLVMRCAAKDPAARPPHFTGIRNVLTQIIDQLDRPQSAAPAPEPAQTVAYPVAPVLVPSAKPQAERNKLILIGAAALVAVLLVAGGWFVFAPTSESTGRVAGAPVSGQPANPAARITTPSGEMVLVPAGNFLFGPNRVETALPAFYIDRTEVTNGMYLKFVTATARPAPPELASAAPDQPVSTVSFEDASDFARWANKRLPLFEEWEKAARGSDGRLFPWGNTSDASRAVVKDAGSSGPSAADSLPAGASPSGALHMAGNVWEWVDQSAQPSPKAFASFATRLTPPLDSGEKWFRIRGGSWREPLPENVLFDSVLVPARYRHQTIGFRCAKSVQ